MKRTVHVARTAHDLTHVNRLVAPSFGVRRLALVAGGKASKSYTPDGSPAPAKTVKGADDFHFVPEKDIVEIQYEIDNKFGVIEGGWLQCYTRFEDKALFTIDLKPLGSTWWSHGEHVIRWDGRLVKPTAEQEATMDGDVAKHDLTTLAPDKSAPRKFPDGFLTLEHTPYKLKMTLVGKEGVGLPPVAWTYWHILIKSIELEVGHEDTIPAAAVDDDRHKMDKAVRARLVADGGIPAAGSTRKIVLVSNVYKTHENQMYNDVGHTQYQSLWADGPNIPIVAKISLLDAADAEVKLHTSPKGAVALGRAKFLWDWEDPDELVSTQNTSADPQAFITDAINYYKVSTDATRPYPKGDNCHKDHGGKRGPDASSVFPRQRGYAAWPAPANLTPGAFPFNVKRCTKRKWAALSEGWTSGAMKGMTGVVFQPSRMAGDDYKLTVYLAYDKKSQTELVLDDITEPLVSPDAIKSKTTGTFQMWREVHVARYIRKKVATGVFSKDPIRKFLPNNVASIGAHLKMAYIDFIDKMGADNNYDLPKHRKKDGTTPDYNTLLTGLLQAANALFSDQLVADTNFDHASVDSMTKVRNYVDFVKRTHQFLADQAAGAAVPEAAKDFRKSGIKPEDLGTANVAGLPAGNATQQARKARLDATQVYLQAQAVTGPLDTKDGYVDNVDMIGFNVSDALADALELVIGGQSGKGEAPPGVTTIHFNFTNSYMRDLFKAGQAPGWWYGKAIDPTDADDSRCVIMFWKPGVDEFSHEYGHHLFLPHAKYPTGNPPGGALDDRHDDTDSGCLMSYSATRPAFCGLCQLRLRGWSSANLDKISANNTKP